MGWADCEFTRILSFLFNYCASLLFIINLAFLNLLLNFIITILPPPPPPPPPAIHLLSCLHVHRMTLKLGGGGGGGLIIEIRVLSYIKQNIMLHIVADAEACLGRAKKCFGTTRGFVERQSGTT